jgi:dipeptidase E
MKFLLTSGGVTNDSVRSALVGLLGKPIERSNALGIPTAQWGHQAGVLLVDGGEATDLAHRVRESGLFDVVPELDDTVRVEVVSEGEWRHLGA